MNLYHNIFVVTPDTIFNSLTPTEMKIHQYIKTQKASIDKLTVTLIAEKCFCSTAAIDRYVKKFEKNGFKDFKATLLFDFQQAEAYKSEDQFSVNTFQIVQYVAQYDCSTFIEKLLALKSKRIYITGIGSSYISAMYLERKLNMLGFDASSLLYFEYMEFKPNCDAIIFISNTGETHFLLELLEYFKSINVPTFAITRHNSKIAKKVDYCIEHNRSFNLKEPEKQDNQLIILLLIEKISELISEIAPNN